MDCGREQLPSRPRSCVARVSLRKCFTNQLNMSLGLRRASAGDLIETTYIGQNDSDAYVLPGIYTENEMCSQGLIGWPAEAAVCHYE